MAANAPTEVRIRAYNVGFGDSFLLTFRYRSGSERHMLMDFGTTSLSKKRGPKDMAQVAQQIREDCGGKLALVAASHRHADHISGFAGQSGRIIAGLDIDLVLQPWTERPDLAPDATGPVSASPSGSGSGPRPTRAMRSAVARLGDMHRVAALVHQEAQRMRRRGVAGGVPRTVIDQLEFLGAENLPNAEAVKNLSTLGRSRVYAHAGTKLWLGRRLPGVRIDVLGPPTLKQTKSIARQAHTDPNEFWRLAAVTADAAMAAQRTRIFPDAPIANHVPQQARWLIPKVNRMNAEELLGLVRILDDAMNNTSLILLLEIGETLILLPGDAQIENWRYALQKAPNAKETRARLAKTKVYKVGHHGSLNATPKQLLWEAFERLTVTAPDDARLVTLLSTLGGKHGSVNRGTEVPRRPLVDALTQRSRFITTQQDIRAKQFWRDVTIPL
jgi:hypothetical protein